MSPFIASLKERTSAWFHPAQPRGRLATVAFWSLVTAVVLFVLKFLPGTRSHIGISPWVALIFWILLSLPRFFRWMRWRLLWRLRNRLFVTYLLIGLTPVVLFGLLAGLASYVLFGQFANFAATSEISPELATLAANNEALALHFQQELVMRLASRRPQTDLLPGAVPAEARMMMSMPELKVGVYLDGHLQPLDVPSGQALTSVPSPPAWAGSNFRGLVSTADAVYFRAITRERAGSHTVAVITSLPLDSTFLARIASGLGRVTLLPKARITAGLMGQTPEGEFVSVGRNGTDQVDASDLVAVTGGVLPKPAGFFDIPINFPTTLETKQWSTGKEFAVIALVASRPSLLYQRLFRQSLVIGGGIRSALILIAVLFAILELLAIFLASRLSRTITQSVSNIYHATREVDQGRLTYRIPVKRQDQLAALSRSFNTMSASLMRLLQEQKEKERMQSELAIAQEVQANLFPRSDVRLGSLELHGFCRPARTVSGDYYDFLVLGSRALCLAIGDISGKGISAALLMAGLHSAVRAYQFASEEIFAERPIGSRQNGHAPAFSTEAFESPGNLMRLLNLHLFHSTQQEKYATLFLAQYEAATRVLRYSNGGQLPPLVLRPDGSVVRLDRGGTVVGLLDNMEYEEGAVTLESGDIVIAYSDGVTEPENEFGDFGELRMVDLIHTNRHLPLDEISACVAKALEDWIGAEEQPDDITLVLARQH